MVTRYSTPAGLGRFTTPCRSRRTDPAYLLACHTPAPPPQHFPRQHLSAPPSPHSVSIVDFTVSDSYLSRVSCPNDLSCIIHILHHSSSTYLACASVYPVCACSSTTRSVLLSSKLPVLVPCPLSVLLPCARSMPLPSSLSNSSPSHWYRSDSRIPCHCLPSRRHSPLPPQSCYDSEPLVAHRVNLPLPLRSVSLLLHAREWSCSVPWSVWSFGYISGVFMSTALHPYRSSPVY
ncbi:hypothetical protein BD309DRAFT_238478 [Dichomitus squalens]|nr:hypothetical protein BD309DRAFT_238478 [Dichomitus squalens]